MKREILFRGKSIQSNITGFVVGDLVRSTSCRDGVYKHHTQISNDMEMVEVDPETIGQYTGLKDKNGVKIFEDDIVTCEIYEREAYKEYESGIPLKVSYSSGGFYPFYKAFGWRSSVEDIEVIGNVHDNLELLNQTT